MGHARKKAEAPTTSRDAERFAADEGEDAPESRVSEILECDFQIDDAGDPIRGIRNALIAGTIAWGVLALTYLLLV